VLRLINVFKIVPLCTTQLIYLLTAIGLTPDGSSTVHIYAQTIHRTITQTIHRTNTHTIHRTITQTIHRTNTQTIHRITQTMHRTHKQCTEHTNNT